MISYSKVIEKHDRIIILCSGSSISPLTVQNLSKVKCPIIAVNGGIEIYSNSNYWVTIDPSLVNYDRMKKKNPNTKYYCGVPEDYGTPDALSKSHRKPILSHVHYLRREHTSLNGLSEDPTTLSTGNSGFAALNLAYLMGAKKILFLGLDGGGTYYNDRLTRPRPDNMNLLNDLFDSVLPQLNSNNIKVLNGSLISKINTFRKVNPMRGIMSI